MVAIHKKEKKFKGKKKAKNVLEKKAKGLKLGQGDRRKVKQLEEKKQLRESIKSKVKTELQNLQDQADEDSLCSESSFGSQPVKDYKKRVSFAGPDNLENTKLFDKNDKELDIKPSLATPSKSILRTKKKKADKQADGEKKKKIKIADAPIVTKQEPNEQKENESEDKPAPKKMKIQVTRKVKEQLMNMPRKERKAFLRELKAKKNPNADRAMECKLLWEKLRSSKTLKAEKDDCTSKLVGLVKGYAAKLIYAHDTCRVIECLLSLKRPGINSMLFDELTPEIIRMTKSKYARFFVLKMLKSGSKEQRDIIINAFRGHAQALLRIVTAAEVLETAFNEYANPQQRFDIISEFYGKEFVLFRTNTPRTLGEIITAEPGKRKMILQYLEENIMGVIDKTTVRLSLTHKLMLDFASFADKDQLTNLVDSLKDKIPELIHTPEGSRLAMKCIWHANAKDRKLIVKNFKDLSVKAAMEHYGHRVLEALFDSVDDTVLVNKYIITELSHEMKRLVEDDWGEKVLHYLVHPRDGRGMERGEIKALEEGDSNPHSKKAKKDRYAELYSGISESLYSYLSANLEQLIFANNKPKFVVGCLETTSQYDLFDRKVPSSFRQSCNSAFVELAKQEFIPMDSDRFHLIEHPSGHFALMGVMRCDKDLAEEERLSVALVNGLTSQQLGSWIACNKGCHVLLKMLHSGSPVVREKIQEAVNMKQLRSYTSKGAVLLAQELK